MLKPTNIVWYFECPSNQRTSCSNITMPQSLLLYSYLQVLDVMSTVAFLMLGVRESNPIVRFAFSIGPNPLAGLLLLKVVAVMIGVYCWRVGRERLLFRVNLIFGLLVAWNLFAIIVAAALRLPAN